MLESDPRSHHPPREQGGAGDLWHHQGRAGQAIAQCQDNWVLTQGGTLPVSCQAAGACPGEVAAVGPLGTQGIHSANRRGIGQSRLEE